jgi:hypothetical protein
MKLVALVLLLAACQDKANQAAPPPATAQPSRTDACTSALVSFDRFIDTGVDTPEARTKVKRAVLERCMTDNWSELALACMRSAKTSHDVFKCWADELTKEQRDTVSRTLGDLKM